MLSTVVDRLNVNDALTSRPFNVRAVVVHADTIKHKINSHNGLLLRPIVLVPGIIFVVPVLLIIMEKSSCAINLF